MKDLTLRLDFHRSLVSRTAAGNRAYLRLTSWDVFHSLGVRVYTQNTFDKLL